MTIRLNEPTNMQRAQWAENALSVFTEQTYGGDRPDTMHPGDLEDAVTDLICDLLHFARLHPGMEPAAVHARALMHFEEETVEEEHHNKQRPMTAPTAADTVTAASEEDAGPAPRRYAVVFAEDVPHYARVEIEAEDDSHALRVARAYDTHSLDYEASWGDAVCRRIVSIEDAGGADVARDVALDDFFLRNGEADRARCDASATMLAALTRFEAAWRNWADDIRRYPKMAESCELFSIYEQARAAIREATGEGSPR